MFSFLLYFISIFISFLLERGLQYCLDLGLPKDGVVMSLCIIYEIVKGGSSFEGDIYSLGMTLRS
jgi:hypothetical protein